MTYRDRFGNMPKLKHDKDAGKSEVITHIAGAMQCDSERASRVFNELRKRGIIVFDRIDRAWHGTDNRTIRYTDSERIERLEKRIENLETKHRKLLAAYRAHIQLGGVSLGGVSGANGAPLIGHLLPPRAAPTIPSK